MIVILAAFALVAFGIGFWIGREFPDAANVGEALVVETITSRFNRPHVLLNKVVWSCGKRKRSKGPEIVTVFTFRSIARFAL